MGVPSHGFRNVLTELASQPIDEIIASMNQVAEGVKAVGVVMEFADSYGIAMPIARSRRGH
jgi:glycerol-3-phosphate dehydrogenase (NAD(P)+)